MPRPFYLTEIGSVRRGAVAIMLGRIEISASQALIAGNRSRHLAVNRKSTYSSAHAIVIWSTRSGSPSRLVTAESKYASTREIRCSIFRMNAALFI